MGFRDYWYVAAEATEIGANHACGFRILDERLVGFRDADGHAVVLRDRCLHRNAPLSAGTVHDGTIACPYHGWTYDGRGRVVGIPSMGRSFDRTHCSPPFPVVERDGYVYVRLNAAAPAPREPFSMPHYREPGWVNLRLRNRFHNTVANCVENFIDIPHTAFVHRGIFRATQGERISATVVRNQDEVHVTYRNERANLGSYRWFLNPRRAEIGHTDSFYAPNVTSVCYRLGRKVFLITSQAVPVAAGETLVFTDLTYSFGRLGALAAPFVRRHGQRIIDQDINILARQMRNIERYGAEFRDTPADTIHRFVDSIREAIARDEDPCALEPLTREIELWV